MDKVFSTRLDESVADRIGGLARRLKTSKKRVIEEAVALLEASLGKGVSTAFLDESFGAWRREESADETVETARETFRQSFERHRP
jgi:predicted transcriptional regulator